MGVIFDTMEEFFQTEGWNYEKMENMPILRMGMNGKNGKWVGYAQAREEQDQFVYYSVCPVNVPEDKKSAMAECITRINYGLVIGNWEMDYRDGEVRYKTSLDVEGDNISSALVRNMVFLNLQMMDRCLPALMGVMYGNLTPEQAAVQIDSQGNPVA
ncbi:MAG TPA: YbjN domain-containing protein [Symbiobacteriaceae bacterium]|nr:YbjN domain-containing protein [Symbiobacteriaceae bacterium]